MKIIIVLIVCLLLGFSGYALANNIGWFPNKSSYEIQELNLEDEFNGIHNFFCVRPREMAQRNKYGYGFVEQYGTVNESPYINVIFKNHFIGFYPYELEVIKLNIPAPKWIRIKRYDWFYDEEGNKQYWYNDYWK